MLYNVFSENDNDDMYIAAAVRMLNAHNWNRITVKNQQYLKKMSSNLVMN